jgi:dipeptidyl aminopeptidase/acylaminoacyl peptidase
MPWEAAKLHIANFTDDGCTLENIAIPPAAAKGASFQPQWDEKSRLWFVNDMSGLGQLYRLDGNECRLFEIAGEECALPLWQFGMRTCAFCGRDKLALVSLRKGRPQLNLIDMESGESEKIDIEPAPGLWEQICATADGELAGIVSTPAQPPSITLFTPPGSTAQGGRKPRDRKAGKWQAHIVKSSLEERLEPEDVSAPRSLMINCAKGEDIQAFYYPPASSICKGPKGGPKGEAKRGPKNAPPPAILLAHGGPTALSDCSFNPKIQFWTSRGFAICDVNYSGSWGFGRQYRQRLDGEWGERDAADMEAAARHLVENGLADGERLFISGSSAGGYTVLMALARSGLFCAGASYYGIADMERLRQSTHKFEAGYIDSLLGLEGLDEEQRRQKLRRRSPIHLAAGITAPVIFFQGLDDKVVPPEQSAIMADSLRQRNIHAELINFAGEGHGFRRSATIIQALEKELTFYREAMGLKCD